MTKEEIVVRRATPQDADHLAILINYAGEGMPLYLWEQMASPDETAWEVGRRRAQRTEGGFSYLNSTLAQIGDAVAGCLIDYAVHDEVEEIDRDATPPMFVPLLELENLVPGSWYLNVLAVHPEFRSQGLGGMLLGEAEKRARQAGKRELSVIVSDSNGGALRLYQRHGYGRRADRPMVKDNWNNDGMNWVLLVKDS